MTVGLAMIPSFVSGTIFPSRRIKSGVDSINQNPIVGAMNFDIAGGQILNSCRNSVLVAKEATNALAHNIMSAEEAIKKTAESSKCLSIAGKVLGFTADHINPIIGATGAVKVLCADDKTNEAIHQALAIGTMLGCEEATKNLVGIAKVEKDKTTGQRVIKERPALYKKCKKLDDVVTKTVKYCEENKLFNKVPLKHAPGAIKGLLFVGASIGGYQLGDSVAEAITNKKSVA